MELVTVLIKRNDDLWTAADLQNDLAESVGG